MNNKSENKDHISVKFNLVAEPGNKSFVLSVNRFLPLINYKRNIENSTKVDLYGRKLIFQTKAQQSGKANVEYAQEVIDLNGGFEMNEISIDVLYEEMGG